MPARGGDCHLLEQGTGLPEVKPVRAAPLSRLLKANGAMTALVDALQHLGLESEVSLSGRWARFEGDCCTVYVAEAARGGYYTWCDDPAMRTVQFHHNPNEAIQAGLLRAGA